MLKNLNKTSYSVQFDVLYSPILFKSTRWEETLTLSDCSQNDVHVCVLESFLIQKCI